MTDSDRLNAAQPHGWEEADWEELLHAIRRGRCTPFLGAGACAGALPLGGEIARALAEKYGYPFEDRHDLSRVAQYIAVERGPQTALDKVTGFLSGKGPPDFSNPNEVHRLAADLRLPVYITTNYDDFMFRALAWNSPGRTPHREVCNWHLMRQRNPPKPKLRFTPSPENPLVFHLHGVLEQDETMVLTEDDYLDFLSFISEGKLLPPRVEQAFTESMLLFLGYSLRDMNFKVLFRKLADYMRWGESTRHVAVQLAPEPPRRRGGAGGEEPELTPAEVAAQVARAERQREYLQTHFNLQKVRIFWGRGDVFAAALRERLDAFNAGR